MNVLGIIARVRAPDAAQVIAALQSIAGVDVAGASADGRLVLVIEDSAATSAAAAMAQVALHPLVLGTSLVYEHAGTSAADEALDGYGAWRMSTHELAQTRPAPAADARLPAA